MTVPPTRRRQKRRHPWCHPPESTQTGDRGRQCHPPENLWRPPTESRCHPPAGLGVIPKPSRRSPGRRLRCHPPENSTQNPVHHPLWSPPTDSRCHPPPDLAMIPVPPTGTPSGATHRQIPAAGGARCHPPEEPGSSTKSRSRSHRAEYSKRIPHPRTPTTILKLHGILLSMLIVEAKNETPVHYLFQRSAPNDREICHKIV